MGRISFIGFVLFLCCLATACQSTVSIPVSVEIKEDFNNASKSYDINYTINNIGFTTAKSYNKHKRQYSDPAIEVCLTIQNNKDNMIEPLFKDAMKRIRLFQRGVECNDITPLFIKGFRHYGGVHNVDSHYRRRWFYRPPPRCGAETVCIEKLCYGYTRS